MLSKTNRMEGTKFTYLKEWTFVTHCLTFLEIQSEYANPF